MKDPTDSRVALAGLRTLLYRARGRHLTLGDFRKPIVRVNLILENTGGALVTSTWTPENRLATYVDNLAIH